MSLPTRLGQHRNCGFRSALAIYAVLLGYMNVSVAAFPLIKNLVTFGDSFTDQVIIGDGGIPWPVYVATYSNHDVSVYNFARAGGTCSNKLTKRVWPDVLGSQMPAYEANVTIGPGGITLIISPENGHYVPLLSDETVYSIWIGTNDVGYDTLMTNPAEDVSVVNTTACVFEWMQQLYDQGARNFLLQNMIPLYLTPFYSPTGYADRFWNLPHNQTEWSILMAEMVRAGNELYALRTKYIAPSLFPGARIGLFDSFGLFNDIYHSPWKYLIGPVYNVTGAINACRYPEGSTEIVCVVQPPEVHDSYLWWDEVHPSEQANRVVARHVLAALRGEGPFVIWNGSV